MKFSSSSCIGNGYGSPCTGNSNNFVSKKISTAHLVRTKFQIIFLLMTHLHTHYALLEIKVRTTSQKKKQRQEVGGEKSRSLAWTCDWLLWAYESDSQRIARKQAMNLGKYWDANCICHDPIPTGLSGNWPHSNLQRRSSWVTQF